VATKRSKNIVICLDGTGNQIEENLSNVLKLYRVLKKTDKQLVFYDQGVGTLGHKYTWGWLSQKIRNGIGLAFGLGLDRNVIQAYEFIVRHYSEYKKTKTQPEEWDNIYIFGFSRGSHTARVLAGMIYEIGILRPEQIHLSGAALTAYKQTVKPRGPKNPSEGNPNTDQEPAGTIGEFEGEGANFRRVAGTRTGSIKFLGLWDTVSSVFIPNPRGFFPPITREKLIHTTRNPAVQTIRHAVAIDEFRRMFRPDHWEPGQEWRPVPYSTGDRVDQDFETRWFAGCHSDIGGGYKRKESGLSQYPLIWMIEEAKKTELLVSDRMAKYVTGVKPWSSTTKHIYPKPDPKAKLHNSLNFVWWLLELFPKRTSRREWPKRFSFLGLYIPMAEPRFIPPDAKLDPSVEKRLKACPDYKPVNLPKP